ncbi:MAG: NRDE family protein, partial [Terriglobales bacterium]
AYWPDQPDILAGRDLQAKGTWLGVARNGKFGSVTNYHGGYDANAVESRGALVSRFLLENLSPEKYVKNLNPDRYSGFNLLVADRDELWWLSNRGNGGRKLAPGYYALGNYLLDTPEMVDIKARFEGTPVAVEPLFSLLATAKIVAPDYGTRCSTVLLQGGGGTQFAERLFDSVGTDGSTLRFEFGPAG